MASTYDWYESYKAAVLETDWTRMPDRVLIAEAEILERRRVLAGDHGGTPEEQQALADAINGLRVLRKDAESWQPDNASKLSPNLSPNSLTETHEP